MLNGILVPCPQVCGICKRVCRILGDESSYSLGTKFTKYFKINKKQDIARFLFASLPIAPSLLPFIQCSSNLAPNALSSTSKVIFFVFFVVAVNRTMWQARFKISKGKLTKLRCHGLCYCSINGNSGLIVCWLYCIPFCETTRLGFNIVTVQKYICILFK